MCICVFILTWNSTSGLYVSIVWGKRGKRGWKWTKHAKSWSKFILDDESKRFCLTYFKTKTKWSARKDRSKKDLDQMASENIVPLLLRWMNDLHSRSFSLASMHKLSSIIISQCLLSSKYLLRQNRFYVNWALCKWDMKILFVLVSTVNSF